MELASLEYLKYILDYLTDKITLCKIPYNLLSVWHSLSPGLLNNGEGAVQILVM
jgi:hypothetical protein